MFSSGDPSSQGPSSQDGGAPLAPKTPLDIARDATAAARNAHTAAESVLRGLEQQRETLQGKIQGDYGPDRAFVALHDR